jgi:hypothetical protein
VQFVNDGLRADDNDLQLEESGHHSPQLQTEETLPTDMVTVLAGSSGPDGQQQRADDSQLAYTESPLIANTLPDHKPPAQEVRARSNSDSQNTEPPRRQEQLYASSRYLRPAHLHARKPRTRPSKVTKPGDLARRTALGLFRSNKLDRCRRSSVWGGRQNSFVLA